jgi:hypothetical protein
MSGVKLAPTGAGNTVGVGHSRVYVPMVERCLGCSLGGSTDLQAVIDPPLFDCAEGEALDEFVLGCEAGDDHG